MEVAEHDDLPLRLRQGGDRPPHALAQLLAPKVGLGVGRVVDELTRERFSVYEAVTRASLAAAPEVANLVPDDGEQPGLDPVLSVEAVERGEEAEHRVLGHVHRVIPVPEHLQR